jgi:hypothetical protein
MTQLKYYTLSNSRTSENYRNPKIQCKWNIRDREEVHKKESRGSQDSPWAWLATQKFSLSTPLARSSHDTSHSKFRDTNNFRSTYGQPSFIYNSWTRWNHTDLSKLPSCHTFSLATEGQKFSVPPSVSASSSFLFNYWKSPFCVTTRVLQTVHTMKWTSSTSLCVSINNEG